MAIKKKILKTDHNILGAGPGVRGWNPLLGNVNNQLIILMVLKLG
jgi:hypothetical protein